MSDEEPCPLFPDMNDCPKIQYFKLQLKNLGKASQEYRHRWLIEKSNNKIIKEHEAQIWDEKCIKCGSTNLEFEDGTPESDLVYITCRDCDEVFDVIRDIRYLKHNAKLAGKCLTCPDKAQCQGE